tara:strand:- start:315 stop:542 length:228 start_codon:yes stop_codon:yes gene_type:complete
METLLSGSIGPIESYQIRAGDLVILPGDQLKDTIGIVIFDNESEHFGYSWIRVLIHTGEMFGYFAEDIVILQSHS